MTSQKSPWSLTSEAETAIEAARKEEFEKENAAQLKSMIEWYHMKEPYIGKNLVLDRDHPDFDPFMIDL